MLAGLVRSGRLRRVGLAELRCERPAGARRLDRDARLCCFRPVPLLFTGFRDAVLAAGGATLGKFLPFAGLSLSLLAVPVLLAIVVPDGFVVSLMGASLGAALILVVPSLIGRRVLADGPAPRASGGRCASSRRSAFWSGCSERPWTVLDPRRTCRSRSPFFLKFDAQILTPGCRCLRPSAAAEPVRGR